MWVANDGRKQVTPEHWDTVYLDDKVDWLSGRMHAEKNAEHVVECMAHIGDVRGKRVLDLGGGLTLCRAMHEAGALSLTVVDYSPAVIDLLCKVEPWAVAVQSDAAEFLNTCAAKWLSGWDVTVTFGLLCYLPPTFLDLLLDKCPSPSLVIGTPTGESYLQYPTRLVNYDRDDIMSAARRHWWQLEYETPKPSHTWVKLRRE